MIGRIDNLVVKENGSIDSFVFIKHHSGDYFLHKSAFEGNWRDLCDLLKYASVEVEFEEDTLSKRGKRALTARVNL